MFGFMDYGVQQLCLARYRSYTYDTPAAAHVAIGKPYIDVTQRSIINHDDSPLAGYVYILTYHNATIKILSLTLFCTFGCLFFSVCATQFG